MIRPKRTNARNHVYFNYNPIYQVYESMWVSSTWPIKVLMQGDITEQGNQVIMNTSTNFPIEDGVMEYVKSEMTYPNDDSVDAFQRRTHIRTSKDQPDSWRYHMEEKAIRIH